MDNNKYYRNILDLVGNGEISEIDIIDEEEDVQNTRTDELLKQLKDARNFDYFKDLNDDLSDDDIQVPNCLPAVTPEKDIKWVEQPFKAPDIILDDLEGSDHVTFLHHPIYYFMQYFDDNIFETIATNTNLYATQKNISDFKPTNKDEIQSFIGIQLIMSVIKAPLNMFWDYMDCRFNIPNTMTEDRYIQLRDNLHIINNLDVPINNQDKFVKVRPLYDQIKKKCNSLPKSRKLSICEQMIPIKKIWSPKVLKKYKKGKSWPWSVKTYVLVSENGTINDFLLYQGDSTELNKNNLKLFGLGPSIILHLVQAVKKNAHFLFFNQFFSSYILLERLYNLGIYAAGIIKPNKFANPLLLTDREMTNRGRWDICEMSSNVKNACSIGILKHYDRKYVVFGSNFITMGEVEKVRVFTENSYNTILVDKPEIVDLYYKSKKSVKMIDNYMNMSKNLFETKKWSVQLIFHAFDIAVFNAWYQYKEGAHKLSLPNEKDISYFDFRLKLSTQMIIQANQ